MRQSLNPRRGPTILATYASARLDAADPSTTIRMVLLSRLLTMRSRSWAVAAYESVDDGDREVRIFPAVVEEDGWRHCYQSDACDASRSRVGSNRASETSTSYLMSLIVSSVLPPSCRSSMRTRNGVETPSTSDACSKRSIFHSVFDGS